MRFIAGAILLSCLALGLSKFCNAKALATVPKHDLSKEQILEARKQFTLTVIGNYPNSTAKNGMVYATKYTINVKNNSKHTLSCITPRYEQYSMDGKLVSYSRNPAIITAGIAPDTEADIDVYVVHAISKPMTMKPTIEDNIDKESIQFVGELSGTCPSTVDVIIQGKQIEHFTEFLIVQSASVCSHNIKIGDKSDLFFERAEKCFVKKESPDAFYYIKDNLPYSYIYRDGDSKYRITFSPTKGEPVWNITKIEHSKFVKKQ